MLINLIKSGKFDFVEEILGADVDINVTDEDGYTALMAAVNFPNETIVNMLLSKGADINAKNNDGKTALYLSLTHCHAELQAEFEATSKHSFSTKIVYALLQAGAQLEETYADFSLTTSHVKPATIMESNPFILKLLMAAGAELKETRLLEHDDSLQDLARKSIRKYLKQFYPDRNLYTTIPQLSLPQRLQAYLLFWTQQEVETNLTKEEKELLYNTIDRDTEGVLSLIQAGVDVNVQDEKGMTPLMLASQNGLVGLGAKLIEAGANMNIQSNSGDTALIHATKKNQINCVQKLIELGANVNIQGGNGQIALNHAAGNEHGNCLEVLLQGGANPDISDHDGYTPLVRAIVHKSLVSVDKLIRAGVNVNYTLRNGTTPLCAAVYTENIDMVKKLIKAGADLNAGQIAPLHFAAEKGNIVCVKELIQAGADVNTRDEDGKGFTPLMMAATTNFSFDCVSTLLKAGAEVDTTYLTYMASMTSFTPSKGTVHNIHYKNRVKGSYVRVE